MRGVHPGLRASGRPPSTRKSHPTATSHYEQPLLPVYTYQRTCTPAGCRCLLRTALRWPSMQPARWWRRAACRRRSSCCSWRSASVSGSPALWCDLGGPGQTMPARRLRMNSIWARRRRHLLIIAVLAPLEYPPVEYPHSLTLGGRNLQVRRLCTRRTWGRRRWRRSWRPWRRSWPTWRPGERAGRGQQKEWRW